MSFFILSISVHKDELWVLEELEKLALLERATRSEMIRRALKEYVKRHQGGNPQKPLFPKKTQELSRYPVERRKQLLESLVETVKANPGVNAQRLIAKFSQATGLRLQTVRDYLKTLHMSGAVIMRGYKLYPPEE